jgi:hypothetical protein
MAERLREAADRTTTQVSCYTRGISAQSMLHSRQKVSDRGRRRRRDRSRDGSENGSGRSSRSGEGMQRWAYAGRVLLWTP